MLWVEICHLWTNSSRGRVGDTVITQEQGSPRFYIYLLYHLCNLVSTEFFSVSFLGGLSHNFPRMAAQQMQSYMDIYFF
jgi:hypothetical protein